MRSLLNIYLGLLLTAVLSICYAMSKTVGMMVVPEIKKRNKTVDSSFSVFKIEMMQFSLFTSFDISVIMNVS